MKTLIYTCCDKKYSHFIPLFVASALYSNSNIDIEIGTSAESLTEDEMKIIYYLQKKYTKSKILINFNVFKELEQGFSEFKGTKVLTNTIRFLIPPVLVSDYIYISDIDIIMFDKNFYLKHIENMANLNLSYSNIVRPETKRMSGLHFSKYDELYPLDLNNIDLSQNDEEVLHDIIKNKKIKINYNTTFRPVHGIHMSLNRPSVEGTNFIPGWGAKPWKNDWNNFKKTNVYKTIFLTAPSFLKDGIKKLNEYYAAI